MRFTESKQMHEALLQAIFESEENQDPLYNIEDGSCFKRVLLNTGKLTEFTCGNDVALKFVLQKVSNYCTYKQDADFSYDKESRLISALFESFDDYSDRWDNETGDIDKATAMQFDNEYVEDSTMKTDKTGMKLIAIKDLQYNSKAYIMKLNYCFDYMLTGTALPPTDEELADALYGPGSKTQAVADEILAMPCFTHLPTPEDITDKMVSDVKCFEIFKKISCTNDYRRILSMMCDNDDGTVWVRIFKDEGGSLKPVFVRLHKAYVYMRWVLYGRNETLWTGFIKHAFDVAGIDCAGLSNNEFARLCFGEDFDADAVAVPEKNAEYYLTHFNEKSSTEYTRFVYEIYLAMMATASFHIKMEPEYYNLGLIIKRLLVIAPTLIDMPKEFLKNIIDALKEANDAYIKAYSGETDKRHIKRIEICKTIDFLCNTYNSEGADSMRLFSLEHANK